MRRFGRLLVPFALWTLSVGPLRAAKEDPVQWTLAPASGSTQVAPGGKAYLELKASIEPGWHLYSPSTPPGGPIITAIKLSDSPAVRVFASIGLNRVSKFDPNFQLETETTQTARPS